MADVQPENGYTRIADELLERVPRYKFNGTQLRIILIVWRYTYGFGRKDHEMSISFFSNATGLGKTQIDRELKNLIGRNVLVITQHSSYTQSRKLSFNKNYDEWGIEKADSQQKSRVSAKTLTVSEKVEGQSAKTLTEGISKNADQDIHSFINNSKDITTSDEIFDKVKNAYCDLHKVLDMPVKDYPMLTKLLDEDIKPELIIEVMKEKFKPGVMTIKYYVAAIRERHEGKSEKPKSKRDKTLLARDRDIAFQKFMEIEGNDPNDFIFDPASGY